MAEQSTFIKLDRNILRWRWWKNKNTLVVFLWLLLNANVADKDFEKVTVHRGEIATSVTSISNATSLTTQQVRTSILHLKSTGEITIKSTNRYQVISIVNYDLYQSKSTNNSTKASTINQQTNNKQITNNQQTNQQQYKNNIKNDKNKRIKRIPPKSPKGGLSSPSGEKQWDNLHAETMMPRDIGTYEDIPSVYRDGTYQSFKTWEEYWDWSNQ